MTGGVLIVGAGQAALQMAASLREYGHSEAITLVGAEAHGPYQRPPLSKKFLSGDDGPSTLSLRDADYYVNNNIALHVSEIVEDVVCAAEPGDGSGYVVTDQGRDIAFDQLAIAVGARPRRLPVPGADLAGVRYLRNVRDAIYLRSDLQDARDIVIIGGGFVGLEAAATARSSGARVTIVEALDRLMKRAVAPAISELYRRAHTRRGVDVRLGVALTAIHGEHGRVAGVELADGSTVPADLVIVGIGVSPRTELAEKLGLECRDGIVVDELARTSNRLIVAAGDCTVAPNPVTGVGLVRLESVDNAINQARVAASTILNRGDVYSGIPWFWSDQFDLKLQIAGLSDGYTSTVTRGDPESEKFSVLYYRDGRLIAVDAVNRAADYLAVRRALSQRMSIAADRAADMAVNLKELIQ